MAERGRHPRRGLLVLVVLVLATGAIIVGVVQRGKSRDVHNAETGDCVGGISAGDDGSVTSDPDDAVRLDCGDSDARYKVLGHGNPSAVHPHPMDVPTDPCAEFPASGITLVLYANGIADEVLCLRARYLSPTEVATLPSILAEAMAGDDPDVCDYFTERGAAQFAAVVDVGSCAEAISTLAGQVTGSPSYQAPPGEALEEVDACALRWDRVGQGPVTGGPRVGHLTLTRVDSGPGYLIDGVRPC